MKNAEPNMPIDEPACSCPNCSSSKNPEAEEGSADSFAAWIHQVMQKQVVDDIPHVLTGPGGVYAKAYHLKLPGAEEPKVIGKLAQPAIHPVDRLSDRLVYLACGVAVGAAFSAFAFLLRFG